MWSKLSRHSLILLVSLPVAACEGISAKEPATKAEQARANDLFLACLVAEAPKYDDSTVPVDDVARVLMNGPCHAQSDAVVETYIRGTSLFVQKGFRRDFEQGIGMDMARGVVIAVRLTQSPQTKI
jgi:hypothetical protein